MISPVDCQDQLPQTVNLESGLESCACGSESLLSETKNGQIDWEFALIGFDKIGDGVRVDRSVESKVEIDLFDETHTNYQERAK